MHPENGYLNPGKCKMMSEFFETNHKRYGKKIKQKQKPCTIY
jgi:hypothetical protein